VSSARSVLRAAAERAGVRDSAVLDAVDAVDRLDYLPAESLAAAATDAALRLPWGQTTSQPSLIALMIEALRLTPASRVLEVGTGYGYEAALLGRLAHEVWTVERIPQLAEVAAANLAGLPHVHVVVGDGAAGLAEHAPYDAVVIAAQADVVPPALIEQLRPGGRLVAPVGGSDVQRCVVLEKGDDGHASEVADLGLVCFVPLIG
jgi:protein-L-isoaspartate(D-aspartate) O-methyltransferase